MYDSSYAILWTRREPGLTPEPASRVRDDNTFVTELLWGLKKRQRGGSARLPCGADAVTAAPSPPLSVEPYLSPAF